MSGFYVSLIFIGILLVIISTVLILIDQKNIFVFRKTFDDKKQELSEIINDAEQMIDELNRFSDYIVNQIDIKNEELNANIAASEQRIRLLEEKAGFIVDNRKTVDIKIDEQDVRAMTQKETKEHSVVNGNQNTSEPLLSTGTVRVHGTAATAYSRSETVTAPALNKKKDKVIPFNNRYSEVLRLSREGMEDLEIAKSLNMGKGEVELVIGLKR